MTLSRRPACTPRCPLPIPSSASQAATAAGAPGGRPCQGPGWRRGPALRPGPPQSPGAPAAWALSWVGRRQRQARQAQRRRLLWTKLRPPRPGGGGGGEKPHRAARVPGTGQCGTGPQRGQQNRDPSRGADGDVPEPRRPLPAQLAAPGNGGGTHMAAMGCEDPALSVRPSLPALVALQLPRSRPSLRPAGPHLLRSRGSRTRGGAHGSLRPSGKGAGRSPAESTMEGRDPGVPPGGGSSQRPGSAGMQRLSGNCSQRRPHSFPRRSPNGVLQKDRLVCPLLRFRGL